MRPRRPRWHAYLLLARISNLPTVWTNVVAGTVAASGAANDVMLLARVGAAASCFYTGGMFLNDAFDARHDARFRPERPIPSGDLSRREAFITGGALLVLAMALLPRRGPVLIAGSLLALGIVVYDYHHKGAPWAPLIMGACRGLLYLLAAAAAAAITPASAVGAAIMTTYVSGLTVVARLSGPRAAFVVPALIAGISIVDASFIAAVSDAYTLAGIVALGFPATLLLQRVIPGD